MAVGSLIRDLRSALGLSQQQLADALCEVADHGTVTKSEVSRWERGARVPGPFWLRHLATVLQAPLALLESEHDVRRRALITGLAGAVIAPAVASDLIEQGFRAALRGGHPSGDDWGEAVVRYGQDYMSHGAGEIQRRLAGDLVVLQQQLETTELWGVAAKLMTVYGKTIPGADGTKAVHWYRLAATAADRSGDLETRVWVRGRAAIALGYEGACLPLADSIADQALELSSKPSLGRLNAIMAKAHVAAVRGDRRAALRLLDDGRGTFEAVGSYEQISDFAVPEWRMGVFTSLLLARLGEERGALDAQDAAIKTLPEELPRFRTHLKMHRGLMLVRAGDRSGVAYAQAALNDLPPEKHSLTLRMLMDEVTAAVHDARVARTKPVRGR